MEFERYKERVKVLHEMLRAECKDVQLSRMRRDLSSDVSKTQQEVEIILYERMTRMLIECRSSLKSTKDTTGTEVETTTEATTTTVPEEVENCQSAINLTESWRQHSAIYKVNNDWECDTKKMVENGRPWFRFTGSAGNILSDHCKNQFSCGTKSPMWSDAEMPTEVYKQATVIAHVSHAGNCKFSTREISVIRCSTDTSYDLVYRYLGNDQCFLAFCGMNKEE